MKTEKAVELGRRIGRAMVRDVMAEDMPREWNGLDPQDGDQLTAAGIAEGSDEWRLAESTARRTYQDIVEGGKGEAMNAIQQQIKAYMQGESLPDVFNIQHFVGMIETGEATYEDFQAVGGDVLAAAVAKSKQHMEEAREG